MGMSNLRNGLKDAKRIVIKVGTSTLTYDTGKLNFSRIDKLARVIADLVNQGKEIVLVTSGAIGVGVGKLKLREKPKIIREKQAVAAVGQCELMHIYSKFFSDYSHIVGQILLTRDVIENQERRQNVINTFETLLDKGIIPIVNENDSMAVDEIKFGENDTLSAIVTELINGELLIILSDIDGFYDCDPRKDPDAKMISVVEEITPEVERCAGGVGSKRGTGGMATKLSAAKIATFSGANMVIASGEDPEIILKIIEGKNEGTLFVSKKPIPNTRVIVKDDEM
ncbi:MAG: glutamate 5-kinase [Clostridia bacterium]|nr:glutamate 5-kinase [Clostridia bacterium]